MHLLVLSAFRRKSQFAKFEIEQVSMHLLVLSTFRRMAWNDLSKRVLMSQCTFWCSVPSDRIVVGE